MHGKGLRNFIIFLIFFQVLVLVCVLFTVAAFAENNVENILIVAREIDCNSLFDERLQLCVVLLILGWQYDFGNS